jgi:hypothetical protein
MLIMDKFPFPQNPHAAIIVGRTGCGKTKFTLDLLEGPYRGKFDYICLLCPTVPDNATYRDRPWIWTDPHVLVIDPTATGRDRLHDWVRGLSKVFRGSAVLFLLDDLSATKSIKRKQDALSELAFSGRHRGHSLWLLTQKYNAVSTDVHENTQWAATFACKDRDSFEEILRDNYLVQSSSEERELRQILASKQHAKLVLRTAYPQCYQVLA